MFHLKSMSPKFVFCIITLLALLSGATMALAQQGEVWKFTYFAGDPPVWHDSQGVYTTRAECEIARAEKTTAGYPVGECSAHTDRRAEPETERVTPPPAQPSQGEREVKLRRARKLLEGCKVGCDTTHQTCVANLTTVEQCMQEQNAKCIERCTSLENLPHHQCINEVCLPTEVNQASWQGLCETQTNTAKVTCQAELEQCKVTCDRENSIP